MLKHTKALEMKKHNQLPLGGQEREAYASQAYLAALEADAEAAGALAEALARVDAAKITIEIWRTESATERAAVNYG